jgi:hypothetical protein
MIILETHYSKKLGLPGFSSHQFSLTLKTELNHLTQLPAEVARLYQQLQTVVDTQLQQPGYVPRPALPERWRCTIRQQERITQILQEQGLTLTDAETLAQARFAQSVTALNKLQASGLIDELLAQVGQSQGTPRFALPGGGQ